MLRIKVSAASQPTNLYLRQKHHNFATLEHTEVQRVHVIALHVPLMNIKQTKDKHRAKKLL